MIQDFKNYNQRKFVNMEIVWDCYHQISTDIFADMVAILKDGAKVLTT